MSTERHVTPYSNKPEQEIKKIELMELNVCDGLGLVVKWHKCWYVFVLSRMNSSTFPQRLLQDRNPALCRSTGNDSL